MFSFQYGRQNAGGLNKLFRSSTLIVSVLTVLVVICAYVLARPIVSVFIRPSSSSYGLALHGFLPIFAGLSVCGHQYLRIRTVHCPTKWKGIGCHLLSAHLFVYRRLPDTAAPYHRRRWNLAGRARGRALFLPGVPVLPLCLPEEVFLYHEGCKAPSAQTPLA